MFLLILGPTGSGKTTAIEALRLLGWAVFDEDAATEGLFGPSTPLPDRVAVALDPDREGPLHTVPDEVRTLRSAGHDVRIVALDANDTTLLFRLARQGRRPPLSDYGMEDIGFAMQRERLADLVQLADARVDTSELEPSELQERVRRLVARPALPR